MSVRHRQIHWNETFESNDQLGHQLHFDLNLILKFMAEDEMKFLRCRWHDCAWLDHLEASIKNSGANLSREKTKSKRWDMHVQHHLIWLVRASLTVAIFVMICKISYWSIVADQSWALFIQLSICSDWKIEWRKSFGESLLFSNASVSFRGTALPDVKDWWLKELSYLQRLNRMKRKLPRGRLMLSDKREKRSRTRCSLGDLHRYYSSSWLR